MLKRRLDTAYYLKAMGLVILAAEFREVKFSMARYGNTSFSSELLNSALIDFIEMSLMSADHMCGRVRML
jgi:hypothetical protein